METVAGEDCDLTGVLQVFGVFGAADRSRTCNLRFTKPLLCH